VGYRVDPQFEVKIAQEAISRIVEEYLNQQEWEKVLPSEELGLSHFDSLDQEIILKNNILRLIKAKDVASFRNL